MFELGTVNRLIRPLNGPDLTKMQQGYGGLDDACDYVTGEGFGLYTITVEIRPRFYSTSDSYDTAADPQGWMAPDPAHAYKDSCASVKRIAGTDTQRGQCWPRIAAGASAYIGDNYAQANVFTPGHFWLLEVGTDNGDIATKATVLRKLAEDLARSA